jgi:fatty-acyl-CoA synthase
MQDHFEAMSRVEANHVALSPISFLKRAAQVYAHRPAVSYGTIKRNWAETAVRCQAIAASLAQSGIGQGDVVSVLSPNIPELFELHYAVPMAGAVLNAINIRLEPNTIAYILAHSECKLVIADTTLAPVLREAFALNGRVLPVIDIVDGQAGHTQGFGQRSYEDLVTGFNTPAVWRLPVDEWEPLALNYTSGTSGRPKGVVYHHRGAYLMALGTATAWPLPLYSVYLSVVPMFHCNGWNHPWAMAIVGGCLVFTRDLSAKRMFQAIAQEGVTHFGAAPVILQMLLDSPEAPRAPFDPKINVFTAGAPPPPAVLERARTLGFDVMQVYGLTETYGHISLCLWQDDWAALPDSEIAEKQAMQGVAFPMVEEMRVVNRDTGADVPMDGVTQGEIAIRGNTVMAGYYKDVEATDAAFEGGWFWSGDAAVMHPNGYVQIRDRLKDVIISGGENISSVEVEAVLYRHPHVRAAAVVARPHARWGEAPCAFIELRDEAVASEADIIGFCRTHLAGFKTPKSVIFCELPKTATGKVQKFILRAQARDLGPGGL